ncbi:hypothetical protein ACREYP_13935 [Enterobacter sp. TMH.L2]
MSKNYAAMSEEKDGECLTLCLGVEYKVTVKYLGDFSGGAATLIQRETGYNDTYSLSGEPGGNEIKLYVGEVLKYYLHGERSTQSLIDEDGDIFYPDLPLKKGQTLRLTDVLNPEQQFKLKLRVLSI